MGKCVYLDANVIGHLVGHSDGLSQEDADKLVMLCSSGKVEPVFNILGLEEQLAAGPIVANRLLDYSLRILNFDKIVKEPKGLLGDDIRSYAYNGCADTPYYSGEKLANLQRNIKDVLVSYTPEKYSELCSSVGDSSQQQSINMKNVLVTAIRRFDEEGASKGLRGGLTDWRKETTFSHFWEIQAESWAECFADRSGVLAKCKKRGIQGLLEIRSVRMGVGIIIAHLYNYIIEKKNPERSDSTDWLHASAAAATTDRFVCHDKRLRRLCGCVPLDGFRALRLPDFMEEMAVSQSENSVI